MVELADQCFAECVDGSWVFGSAILLHIANNNWSLSCDLHELLFFAVLSLMVCTNRSTSSKIIWIIVIQSDYFYC